VSCTIRMKASCCGAVGSTNLILAGPWCHSEHVVRVTTHQ
jgi:hypothetical protein